MDTAENHRGMAEPGEKQRQTAEPGEKQTWMAEPGKKQKWTAAPREKQQQMAAPESTQQQATNTLLEDLTEEHLWECIVAFQGEPFLTMSGLPYTYTLKQGKRGGFTRELWVDRRENSKSITWSSVKIAFQNLLKMKEALPEGEIPYVKRPKALGDIRGISYIYPLFYRFGLLEIHAEKEDSFDRR